MVLDRLPVLPTRSVYKAVSMQLVGARNGHRLLKVKAAALQAELRAPGKEFDASLLSDLFKKAVAQLCDAEFFGADLESSALACERECVHIQTVTRSVCGVVVPAFQVVKEAIKPRLCGYGSRKIQAARGACREFLSELIKAAGEVARTKAISSVLSATNRRINALDHIIIPKLESTLLFINNELEEQEREEFFRLKRIQQSS